MLYRQFKVLSIVFFNIFLKIFKATQKRKISSKYLKHILLHFLYNRYVNFESAYMLHFGCQISQRLTSKKISGHSFAVMTLPPENPEQEKRARFEIDFVNQMLEPKEKKIDLPVD